MHRTYLQGRKLTFAKALALYEQIVQRKATKQERASMARAWLAKTNKRQINRPRQK